MGKIHRLKIMPGSEAESSFMNLLKQVNVKHESVMCRVGAIFGTPYNEYVISDGLFRQIQSHLSESGEF